MNSHRRRRVIWALGCGALLLIAPLHQLRAFQSPQPSDTERRGSAVVRGTVVAAESGLPLQRAYVRMSVERGNEIGAVTDAKGGFEIKNLPAGLYGISAATADRVRLGYSLNFAPLSDLTIAVANDAVIENVRLALLPGAVIAGTFVDETGVLIAGARVSALRPEIRYSGTTIEPNSFKLPAYYDLTDDHGGFRIIGLPAGTYYVAATSEARLGSYSGRNPLRDLDFKTAYHPATYDPGQAVAVSVETGQERTANISLSTSQMARVTGTVLSDSGTPQPNALVQLSNVTSHLPVARPTTYLRATADARGGFELVHVPPGDYDLHASLDDKNAANRRHTTVRIRVAASDVKDLTLTLKAGGIATGRVVVDDTTISPAWLDAATVFLHGARPVRGPGIPPQSRLAADGTFAISNTFDWRYVRVGFGFSPLSVAYCLDEVRWHGKNVTDTPLDFTSRVDGLEIRLTDKCASLEGVVTHADGSPARNVGVIAFSRASEHWMYDSRFVRQVNTDAAGRYRLFGLPGEVEYSVIAGVDIGLYLEDHTVRPKLSALAQAVRIGKGESKQQDLKVVPFKP